MVKKAPHNLFVLEMVHQTLHPKISTWRKTWKPRPEQKHCPRHGSKTFFLSSRHPCWSWRWLGPDFRSHLRTSRLMTSPCLPIWTVVKKPLAVFCFFLANTISAILCRSSSFKIRLIKMPKLICIRKSLTQFVSPLICNHLPWEPKSSLKSPSAELRFLEKVGVRGVVPSMAQAWDAMEIKWKRKTTSTPLLWPYTCSTASRNVAITHQYVIPSPIFMWTPFEICLQLFDLGRASLNVRWTSCEVGHVPKDQNNDRSGPSTGCSSLANVIWKFQRPFQDRWFLQRGSNFTFYCHHRWISARLTSS